MEAAIQALAKVSSMRFSRPSRKIGASASGLFLLTGSLHRCLVFAYGSGVFQQQGQQMKDNMTDFIFCVEVPDTWQKDYQS